MLPIEGSEILRVAILSGIIGFVGFGASYGIYVWRKRNSGAKPARRLPMRVAQLSALVGLSAVGLSWAHTEFRGRVGIAGGSDVFVVTPRGDISAQQITTADKVAQGDVVAQFLTPADRSRLLGIDLQKSQAEAKRQAIQSKVLQTDEALLQEQTHLRAALLQVKGFAFQLQHARNEAERERAALVTAWTREESTLLEDLAMAEREHSASLARRTITRSALERGEDLQKRGNISRQQLDVRSADDLSVALAISKGEKAIAALKERRDALSQRSSSNVAAVDRQLQQIARDEEALTTEIDQLQRKVEQVRRSLDADRARAVGSRQSEVDAVDYDITILTAEKTRLTELGQVRAPFDGKVVYRHPAPGLAAGATPILVISAGTGFTASVRLPRSELDELAAETNPIKLALDAPLLHQFFTGRFVRSETVAFESDWVIAYFDCSLPPEIIGQLGNGADPLRVRLLWRPSLLRNAGFLVGVSFLALSMACLGASARSGKPRRRVRKTVASPQPGRDGLIKVTRDLGVMPRAALAQRIPTREEVRDHAG